MIATLQALRTPPLPVVMIVKQIAKLTPHQIFYFLPLSILQSLVALANKAVMIFYTAVFRVFSNHFFPHFTACHLCDSWRQPFISQCITVVIFCLAEGSKTLNSRTLMFFLLSSHFLLRRK